MKNLEMAEKITKKNISDFTINGDKLIYIPTGEIIDNCFMVHDYMNIMQDLDKEKDISRDFFCNNWNSKKKFTKVYQIDVKDYCKDLSAQALGLFFILMSNLRKSSNEVIIDGVRPTNQQLAELLNVKERSVRNYLGELEEKHIIKRLGSTSNRMILVNPYICFNGKNAMKSTVEHFE